MAEAEAQSAPAGSASIRTVIEVVEKRSEYSLRGSAFGLAPNGLKALRELCPEVADQLVEEGICISQGGGVEDTAASGADGPYLIPWYRVREALYHRALRYGEAAGPSGEGGSGKGGVTVRFRMGWNLQSIEHIYFDDNRNEGSAVVAPPRGVRAAFSNGEVLEGSVLVAADGIHSKVRELLGLPPCRHPPATRVWRGHATAPPTSILHPYVTSGKATALALAVGRSFVVSMSFHEKAPGTTAWTVTSKEPGIRPDSHVLEVLGPHLSPDSASGREKPSSSSEGTSRRGAVVLDAAQSELIRELFRLTEPQSDLTAVYDNTVVDLPPEGEETEGWGGTGRVVMIGDAAHAMRPVHGLGGAMAFEDALLLCRKLRDVWWTHNGKDSSGIVASPASGGSGRQSGASVRRRTTLSPESSSAGSVPLTTTSRPGSLPGSRAYRVG
jgi:2-polyprenyl-6-methoxyphenol hydroxylase-like FAD-dependent oxidoreductase